LIVHFAFRCATATLAAVTLSTPLLAQDVGVDVKISGGQATYVPLDKAGLPPSSLPGVKFITSAQMAKMKQPTESGVFVIDGRNVPQGLPEQLRSQQYTLSPNGTLTHGNGERLAVFVHSLTYKLGNKKLGEPRGGIKRFADAIGVALVPSAHAGDPYPFDCFTTNLWAVYQLSDFHRWQQAHTFAEANGSLVDGSCGPGRPPTAIRFISVRAGFTNPAGPPPALSLRECRNCQRSSVMRQNDFGFFWPAIGSTRTNVHQINMFDPTGRGRHDVYIEWRR
jgi:hypothetical protein